MEKDLYDSLSAVNITAVSEETLQELLGSVDVVRRIDTQLQGFIYLLWKDPFWIIAEYLDATKAVLRRVDSRKAGESFIEKRLAAYEKMWDGCGCRIDYFE